MEWGWECDQEYWYMRLLRIVGSFSCVVCVVAYGERFMWWIVPMLNSLQVIGGGGFYMIVWLGMHVFERSVATYDRFVSFTVVSRVNPKLKKFENKFLLIQLLWLQRLWLSSSLLLLSSSLLSRFRSSSLPSSTSFALRNVFEWTTTNFYDSHEYLDNAKIKTKRVETNNTIMQWMILFEFCIQGNMPL